MNKSKPSPTGRVGPPRSAQPLKAGRAPAQPARSRPAAPPVYRPQAPPRVLQTKTASGQASPPPTPLRSPNTPTAPPVYRPQPIPRCLQAKAAPGRQVVGAQSAKIPSAPPPRAPWQASIKAAAGNPGRQGGMVQAKTVNAGNAFSRQSGGVQAPGAYRAVAAPPAHKSNAQAVQRKIVPHPPRPVAGRGRGTRVIQPLIIKTGRPTNHLDSSDDIRSQHETELGAALVHDITGQNVTYLHNTPLQFDQRNYIVGHGTPGRLAGKTPADLAQILIANGFTNGMSLDLLACDTTSGRAPENFAQELYNILTGPPHNLTNIELTGARGLMTEYSDASGRVKGDIFQNYPAQYSLDASRQMSARLDAVTLGDFAARIYAIASHAEDPDRFTYVADIMTALRKRVQGNISELLPQTLKSTKLSDEKKLADLFTELDRLDRDPGKIKQALKVMDEFASGAFKVKIKKNQVPLPDTYRNRFEQLQQKHVTRAQDAQRQYLVDVMGSDGGTKVTPGYISYHSQGKTFRSHWLDR